MVSVLFIGLRTLCCVDFSSLKNFDHVMKLFDVAFRCMYEVFLAQWLAVY